MLGTKEKRSIDDVLLPILCFSLFLQHLRWVFPWVEMSRITAPSREVLTLIFPFVLTNPLHRCSFANMAWDPFGFRWSCANNFGILTRGAYCPNVHLARLIAGVQKASLDVHDISLASGSTDVSRYEVSPAHAHCNETGKRISRMRSRSDCLFSSSHWRSDNGARH